MRTDDYSIPPETRLKLVPSRTIERTKRAEDRFALKLSGCELA
jgi:hypothetical protein